MDFSSLKEQVSNLTLYDLKAGVRKVQNGMFKQQLYLPPIPKQKVLMIGIE